MKIRKKLVFLPLFALLLAMLAPAASVPGGRFSTLPGAAMEAYAAETAWRTALKETLSAVYEDYPEPGYGDEWEVFALARGGKVSLDSEYFSGYSNRLGEYLADHYEDEILGSPDSKTNSRIVLALSAINQSAANVNGKDLLSGYRDLDWSEDDSDPTGAAYAILALNSRKEYRSDYASEISALAEWLAGCANEDAATGGSYWIGVWGDVTDTTSMAVQALASCGSKYSALTDKALTYLKTLQTADGNMLSYNAYYPEYSYTSPCTTAQTVIALSALKKNAESWKTSGSSDVASPSDLPAPGVPMITGLINEFYEGEGVFNDGWDPKLPTEQSCLALIAYSRYKSGATMLFDCSDVEKDTSDDDSDDDNTPDSNSSDNGTNGSGTSGDSSGNASGGDSSSESSTPGSGKTSGGGSSGGGGSTGRGAFSSSSSGRTGIEAMVGVETQTPEEGEWLYHEEDDSWSFLVGGKPIAGRWALIKNSYSSSGLSAWFYFDTNGIMLTGWQKIPERSGALKWYYLNPYSNNWKGACYLSCYTPDGYYVGADGAWDGKDAVKTAAGDVTSLFGSSMPQIGSTAQQSVSSVQQPGTAGPVAFTSAGSVLRAPSGNIYQAGTGGTRSGGGSSSSAGSSSAGSTSGGSSDTSDKQEARIEIAITVDGSLGDADGNRSFSDSGSVKISKNASVYTALKTFASENGWTVNGSSSYVSGINGLKEKSNGSLSGWVYTVNGDRPSKSAGNYHLEDGDEVVWTFVEGPD